MRRRNLPEARTLPVAQPLVGLRSFTSVARGVYAAAWLPPGIVTLSGGSPRMVKKLGRSLGSAMMDSPNGEGENVRTSAGIRNGAGKSRVAAAESVSGSGEPHPAFTPAATIADVIVSSLRYGETELQLYVLRAWVVMANHVNVLLFPNSTSARITRSLKTNTARQANILLNRQGQRFWQAGVVCRAEDWPWSSANRQ